jgi:hypothetical protein
VPLSAHVFLINAQCFGLEKRPARVVSARDYVSSIFDRPSRRVSLVSSLSASAGKDQDETDRPWASKGELLPDHHLPALIAVLDTAYTQSPLSHIPVCLWQDVYEASADVRVPFMCATT